MVSSTVARYSTKSSATTNQTEATTPAPAHANVGPPTGQELHSLVSVGLTQPLSGSRVRVGPVDVCVYVGVQDELRDVLRNANHPG